MFLCLASGRRTWLRYYKNNNIDYLLDLKYPKILDAIKTIPLTSLSITKEMSIEFIETTINQLIGRKIKFSSKG